MPCFRNKLTIFDIFFSTSLDPPAFLTHPQETYIKLGQATQLTCSYKNYTHVTFNWMKDGQNLELQETGNVSQSGAVENETVMSLSLAASNPNTQGYYYCMVKDNFGYAVESEQALVRFTGKLRFPST